MKKKFRLWLNIVTICLCVCAVAIGVYAATSATLTVQGQIGFEAHGCDIDASGYVFGHKTVVGTVEQPKSEDDEEVSDESENSNETIESTTDDDTISLKHIKNIEQIEKS